MKKLPLFVLLAMIMVGCEEKEGRNYATDERGYTYEVLIIDSCEYFRSTYILTHKGNCRFCMERNKKMVKEQIDTALLEIFD